MKQRLRFLKFNQGKEVCSDINKLGGVVQIPFNRAVLVKKAEYLSSEVLEMVGGRKLSGK